MAFQDLKEASLASEQQRLSQSKLFKSIVHKPDSSLICACHKFEDHCHQVDGCFTYESRARRNHWQKWDRWYAHQFAYWVASMVVELSIYTQKQPSLYTLCHKGYLCQLYQALECFLTAISIWCERLEYTLTGSLPYAIETVLTFKKVQLYFWRQWDVR